MVKCAGLAQFGVFHYLYLRTSPGAKITMKYKKPAYPDDMCTNR
jgi:hypothetical protein